jgi:outer membrane beta-barrel protein
MRRRKRRRVPDASNAGAPAPTGEAAASAAAVPAAEISTPPEAASQRDSTVIPHATVQVVHTPVAVVRSGPGPQHPIVATLPEGEVLTIDARSGAWYHLQLADTKSGWVHEDLLQTYVDPRKFEFAPDPGLPSRMRSFHFVAFGGNYAADREDNGLLLGARMGYSLTRRFAFEVGLGYTRVVRTTYVLERIFGLRLEEEVFKMFFYEAGASMDILPGRRVTPFITAAAGASVLEGHAEPTYTVGLGTKFFVSKRTALRWELRDHRMHGGNQFTRFSGDNLEFSGGCELLF